MSLLAILISLALEKLLPAINKLRSLAWFEQYQYWVRTQLAKQTASKKWQGIPSLLIIVLLPVIGVAIIQHVLDGLLTLFSFLFSIAVLVYCLGPEDEHRRLNDYLDAADNGDEEIAKSALAELLKTSKHTNKEINDNTENETTHINQLIESVLILTHDRMLAVLFWFVILGPMGAVLYRLTLALHQNPEQGLPQEIVKKTAETTGSSIDTANDDSTGFANAADRLHHLLGWIPSHLTALSYAVMGSFIHALRAWNNRPIEYSAKNNETEALDNAEQALPANHNLLLHIGKASLQFDNHPPKNNNAVRETLGMCGRSLVTWVTILALMTLAGWAS